MQCLVDVTGLAQEPQVVRQAGLQFDEFALALHDLGDSRGQVGQIDLQAGHLLDGRADLGAMLISLRFHRLEQSDELTLAPLRRWFRSCRATFPSFAARAASDTGAAPPTAVASLGSAGPDA